MRLQFVVTFWHMCVHIQPCIPPPYAHPEIVFTRLYIIRFIYVYILSVRVPFCPSPLWAPLGARENTRIEFSLDPSSPAFPSAAAKAITYNFLARVMAAAAAGAGEGRGTTIHFHIIRRWRNICRALPRPRLGVCGGEGSKFSIRQRGVGGGAGRGWEFGSLYVI